MHMLVNGTGQVKLKGLHHQAFSVSLVLRACMRKTFVKPAQGSNNWEGLFAPPSGNKPSAIPITDKAFQQELVKYGNLVMVAYAYYEGSEYKTWQQQNAANPNPKSTLPIVRLL